MITLKAEVFLPVLKSSWIVEASWVSVCYLHPHIRHMLSRAPRFYDHHSSLSWRRGMMLSEQLWNVERFVPILATVTPFSKTLGAVWDCTSILFLCTIVPRLYNIDIDIVCSLPSLHFSFAACTKGLRECWLQSTAAVWNPQPWRGKQHWWHLLIYFSFIHAIYMCVLWHVYL